MKLSIVDRVILLHGFFPSSGTVEEMEVIHSITRKLTICADEQAGLRLEQNRDGTTQVEVTDLRCYERDKDFDLTAEEQAFLEFCADRIDEQRGVTAFSLATIKYLKAMNGTRDR